jgi:hypothetical protein
VRGDRPAEHRSWELAELDGAVSAVTVAELAYGLDIDDPVQRLADATSEQDMLDDGVVREPDRLTVRASASSSSVNGLVVAGSMIWLRADSLVATVEMGRGYSH